MPKNITTPGHSPKLTKLHKLSIAGVATLGAATLAFSLVPDNSHTTTNDAAVSTAKVAYSDKQIKDVKGSVTDQLAGADLKAQAIAAKKKAADAAAAKKKAAEAVAAKKKAAAKKAAQARSKAAA
ncbi:lytic transglycosylase, partial [Streptomyces sp. NPDC005534]